MNSFKSSSDKNKQTKRPLNSSMPNFKMNIKVLLPSSKISKKIPQILNLSF